MALSLLLPRTRLTPAQARAPLTRVLALLLPGSGLMNSPWGGMLLLAWAAVLTALAPGAAWSRFRRCRCWPPAPCRAA